MTSVAQAIKGVLPRLVVFFKTLTIYFVVFIPQDQPSVLSTILKCLPVIGLIVFVILQTKSAGTESQFSKYITTGLLFGCIGDALLVWHDFFDLGVVSFLIGHLLYIRAFTFQPLNLVVGVVCLLISVLGSLFFWSGLHGVLIVGAPIYSAIIMVMVWRAISRVEFSENKWTWSKLVTCLGAISFAISDFFVGLNRFHGPFAYDQLIIMTTYYAAQFGIAISILDAKLEPIKNDSSCTSDMKSVPINSHEKAY
ncbi:hypothetical protein RN001_002734 [Aquatica leii]|uniref:lysoplasmalogenase n=1 Tax=Aquatica leii TaxID=1421715 RepID=A0AAN7PHL5_9COLE|nr:hypothetical protein RN001_002734 [Aquatica leii]